MMFSQTVCKPGSYIEVVPVGLLAKLQYNKDGLLEKVQVGLEDDSQCITGSSLSVLNNVVPITISLTGGTTWVEGVFYSDDISLSSGSLPECTYEDYSSRNIATLKFYAGNVTSLAASFAGCLTVRNWLSIQKFDLLPGIVVPQKITSDTINMLLNSGNYHFKHPYIAGFFVFEGTEPARFVSSGFKQCKVKRVDYEQDEFGTIICTVQTDTGTLKLNASDVWYHNVSARNHILYTDNDCIDILATRTAEGDVNTRLTSTYVCPTCHKVVTLPVSGPCFCDNSECLSKMYPQVLRLLSCLHLPSISFERYKDAVNHGDIVSVVDVLSLAEFESSRPKASLAQAIASVTPVEVCADDGFFTHLANTCNNNVATFMYYAENPLRMQTDMNVQSLCGERFIRHLSNMSFVSDLRAVLAAVDTLEVQKKFEGAPIFRGTTFALTGKFKRGTYDDICSIIQSYSGIIIHSIDEEMPKCVITGSTYENIDGYVISKASKMNIPILEEDFFFEQYEIDKDIAENLL